MKGSTIKPVNEQMLIRVTKRNPYPQTVTDKHNLDMAEITIFAIPIKIITTVNDVVHISSTRGHPVTLSVPGKNILEELALSYGGC